ncbi:hypothetical protein FRIGORI9N_240108 [Frigoribacterium sp. 9N]|nr:hypothetical protein FRIGORI9N_240108 [Frigoribacterium sp. 9N]
MAAAHDGASGLRPDRPTSRRTRRGRARGRHGRRPHPDPSGTGGARVDLAPLVPLTARHRTAGRAVRRRGARRSARVR